MGSMVKWRRAAPAALALLLLWPVSAWAFQQAGGSMLVETSEIGEPILIRVARGLLALAVILFVLSRFSAKRKSIDWSLVAKGLSLHVVFMLLPMLSGIGGDDHKQILEELAGLVDAGRIRPLIDPSPFTLETIGAAHEYAESGAAVGKVVIDIANAA